MKRFQKRSKKTFILIEVLIAITILFLCGFAVFEIQSGIARKLRSEIDQNIKLRLLNRAFSRLLEDLYTNKISWQKIEQSGKYTIVLEQNRWEALVEFSKNPQNKDKENEKPPDNALDICATITIQALHGAIPPKEVKYNFCVTKQPVKNDKT
jgi:hypothetical protein